MRPCLSPGKLVAEVQALKQEEASEEEYDYRQT
jgi:hypothetical protein